MFSRKGSGLPSLAVATCSVQLRNLTGSHNTLCLTSYTHSLGSFCVNPGTKQIWRGREAGPWPLKPQILPQYTTEKAEGGSCSWRTMGTPNHHSLTVQPLCFPAKAFLSLQLWMGIAHGTQEGFIQNPTWTKQFRSHKGPQSRRTG